MQKGLCNKPTKLKFQSILTRCSQNATNQLKSTVKLGYMCPRGLSGPPAVTNHPMSNNSQSLTTARHKTRSQLSENRDGYRANMTSYNFDKIWGGANTLKILKKKQEKKKTSLNTYTILDYNIDHMRILLSGFFCGCRGLCHGTEPDLFLFLFEYTHQKSYTGQSIVKTWNMMSQIAK